MLTCLLGEETGPDRKRGRCALGYRPTSLSVIGVPAPESRGDGDQLSAVGEPQRLCVSRLSAKSSKALMPSPPPPRDPQKNHSRQDFQAESFPEPVAQGCVLVATWETSEVPGESNGLRVSVCPVFVEGNAGRSDFRSD